MRVVLVTPEYPPAAHLGGIGTNTAVLASALAAAGHAVTVVVPASADVPAAESRKGGVRIIRIPRLASPGWLPGSDIVDRVALRASIALVCRRERADVVHAAEWEALAWLASYAGTPVVTRLATPTHVVDALNGRRPDPATRLVYRWERAQARRSTAVYAPTRAIADRVAEDWGLPEAEIEIVPNPVDLASVRDAARADPPIPVGENAVVFTGRIERRKGIDVFATAMVHVLEQHPEATAIVIGRDVEDDRRLARSVRAELARFGGRVVFTGGLPWEQQLAIVARARVVALPSLWESFGYVCVEAMALGALVVVSDVGGFAEIVTDGHDGCRVPAGDPAALADAITRGLRDDADVRSMRHAAKVRATDFDVERVVGGVESVLERAAKRKVDRSIFVAGYRNHFRPDDTDPFADLYARKRDHVVEVLASTPRQRLLDVGGGFGRISGPLASIHDVVLCDLSPEMLSEARERVGARLPLARADALRLPFPDACVDGVIALDLLVHLPDLAAALHELARVVRPGGWMIVDSTNAIAGWVLAHPEYVERRPGRMVRTVLAGGVLPEWTSVVRHQTARQMRRHLRAEGLEIESVVPFGPRLTPKWHLWRLTRP